MKKPNKLKSILQTTNSKQINRQIERNSDSSGSFGRIFARIRGASRGFDKLLKPANKIVKCLRDLEQITIKMKED